MTTSQFGNPTHQCRACRISVVLKKNESAANCSNCGKPFTAVDEPNRIPRPSFHETRDGDLAIHYE